MNTLAPSFLIGSSSFLQVSRTCMNAWMSSNFGKFATELLPLIDVRIEFLFNIFKTNRPIKTKFCKHIIIDNIYFGIVNRCFSQIGKRVMALDWRQNLVFSSPEPKAQRWAYSIPVDSESVRPCVRPSVRKHFQTRIFPQPVGQS